jgi:hypothetical protein
MSLELKPETEDAVREYAEREGVSVDELLARTFAKKPPARSAVSASEKERAVALLRRWQQEMPAVAPPPPNDGSLTPSEALFRQWEQEDAALTDAQRAEQEELWQDYQQGIGAERAASGMRPLF